MASGAERSGSGAPVPHVDASGSRVAESRHLASSKTANRRSSFPRSSSERRSSSLLLRGASNASLFIAQANAAHRDALANAERLRDAEKNAERRDKQRRREQRNSALSKEDYRLEDKCHRSLEHLDRMELMYLNIKQGLQQLRASLFASVDVVPSRGGRARHAPAAGLARRRR